MGQEAFGKVLQLTQVPRPRILLARIQQHAGKARGRNPIAPGQPVHQMPQQQRDFLVPLAQRWHAQLKNAQAVEQLFLNSFLRRRQLQVAAGGRDDAHIRADRVLATAPDKLSRLQQFQQPLLHRARHDIELVQQDRSFGALLELTRRRFRPPVGGSVFVAEQFILQQVGGEHGALDLHEREAGTNRKRMDKPGSGRLPAPRLSRNQHRHIRLRKQFRLRTQPACGRAGRNEIQLFADSLDFWLIHDVRRLIA